MDIEFDPAYRYGELTARYSSEKASATIDKEDIDASATQRQSLARITVEAKVRDTEQKRKFIELRAQGLSFNKIARELHVSKPTLISWNREFADTIKNYMAIEHDALQEEYLTSRRARIELLGGILKKIEAEIDSRDLAAVPTHKLLELLLKYSVNLRDDEMPLEFSETPEIEGPFKE